jgi:hypothetical protein
MGVVLLTTALARWMPAHAHTASDRTPRRRMPGRHGPERLHQAHPQTDATTRGCRAQPGACTGPYAFSPSLVALPGSSVLSLIEHLNRPAADLPGESVGMGSRDAGLHTN